MVDSTNGEQCAARRAPSGGTPCGLPAYVGKDYRETPRLFRGGQGHPAETPGRHRTVRGHEGIAEVVLVDQSRVGKTTRSNPASYVGALAGIRKAFAPEPLARERGYTAGAFSFNSGTGRCPACGGKVSNTWRCSS